MIVVVRDRSDRGGHCGDDRLDTRARPLMRPEQIQPTGSWWARLVCRLFAHQLACCPNHSVFVYWPAGHLVGCICERCGDLIGRGA